MKFLRNLLKGLSLTTALFIFEACYGPPMDVKRIKAEFKVVSAEDLTPLKDITVNFRVLNNSQLQWREFGATDVAGYFNFLYYEEAFVTPEFRFESPDGSYIAKDTVIRDYSKLIEIKLEKNPIEAPEN